MSVPTLEEMEERAKRYLDGMTVNKDAMARDVLMLVSTIRGAQKRAAENSAKSSYQSSFADLYGEIFPWFGRKQ